MILALDMGNTNIVIGCIDSQKTYFVERVTTDHAKTGTEYAINIKNILESDGLSMANVVKTTVLLNNIADFGAMNEVYATFFEGACPARAAFEVAALPKGALVEIEAIAYAE